MRLFIALPLSKKIEQELGNYIEQLKKGGGHVKWVKPSSIHLTIKFLGETDNSLLASISKAIDNLASAHKPLQLSINSLGAFPNSNRPRVFWAGLDGELDKLTELAAQTDLPIAQLGFKKETRSFKPHLTLGRVKDNHQIDQTVKILEMTKVIKSDFVCDKIVLFQSTLTPQGAIYNRLHEASLGDLRFGD